MILRPFKKIKEQKEIIDRLSREIEHYERREEERIRKAKEKLHQCSYLCKGCQNFVTDGYCGYGCKLDCKCEDRKDG